MSVVSEKLFPSEIHAIDLIPEGWKVVEDVSLSVVDVEKLKKRHFGSNVKVKGNEWLPDSVQYAEPTKFATVRKRAVKLNGNLGLVDAKHMLAEQDRIPIKFRGFWILLPGTVLRDRSGSKQVRTLWFDYRCGWCITNCIDWRICCCLACTK